MVQKRFSRLFQFWILIGALFLFHIFLLKYPKEPPVKRRPETRNRLVGFRKSDHQVELPSHVDLPRCFRWRNTTHFSYLLMFLLSPGFTNSGGIESRFYKLESSPVQSSPVQLFTICLPWGAVFAVREPRVWKSRASETRAVELYAESVQNSSATWEWFSKGWKYSWRTVYSARTDEVLWKKPRHKPIGVCPFPTLEFFFHGNHNTWTLMRASDTAANRMSVRPFAPDNRTPNISFVVD